MDIHEDLAKFREQKREAAERKEAAEQDRLREQQASRARGRQKLITVLRNEGIAPGPLYVYMGSKKKRWSTLTTSIFRHIGDGWRIWSEDQSDGDSFDMVLTPEGVEHVARKWMTPNEPDTIGIDHGPGWQVKACACLVDPQNRRLQPCFHDFTYGPHYPEERERFIAFASQVIDLNLGP